MGERSHLKADAASTATTQIEECCSLPASPANAQSWPKEFQNHLSPTVNSGHASRGCKYLHWGRCHQWHSRESHRAQETREIMGGNSIDSDVEQFLDALASDGDHGGGYARQHMPSSTMAMIWKIITRTFGSEGRTYLVCSFDPLRHEHKHM